MTKPEADMQPAPEQPTSPFLNEALSYLTGEGRTRTPSVLLDDLRSRFREAGREKLADLVYEMVKACLRAIPDFSKRIILREEPRQAEIISGEMGTLSGRMAQLSDPVDLATIPTCGSSEEQALCDADKCIDMLERLEGSSGRRLLTRAMWHAYAGEFDRAESALRTILRHDKHSDDIRFYASWNLAFVLLRAHRNEEALQYAQQAVSIAPEHPGGYTDVATAAALLGDQPKFLWSLRRLRELYSERPSNFVADWYQFLVDEHAGRLCIDITQLPPLAEDVRSQK